MGYIERKHNKIESIYRQYKDDVYRVCLHFTKDPSISQEIGQQTFFNFYEHIDEVEESGVRGYLLRSARNLSFNYLRDKKRECLRDSWDLLEEDADIVISVEEIYLRKEEKQQKEMLSNTILERLQQENEDWYKAINLAYCLGKPQDVIADEMGISRDALYSLIYRAKRWIRKRYEEQYEDIVRNS